MSRTYRNRCDSNIKWLYRDYYGYTATTEEIEKYGLVYGNWGGIYRPINKNSKEGKAITARFRSDAYKEFKEPGPSWFRNLFTEKPLRRKAKNELRKFMMDNEYEPIIESMGKLEYWT